MPRFRGTVLSGRSGRRGCNYQYLLGHGKGPGRRMSTKVMAPEPFPYQRPRRKSIPPTKTEIGRRQDLRTLTEQAQAIESRLRFLEQRIRDIEQKHARSNFKAFVDSESCVGCGTCVDVCPTGAISVEEIARVDPKRCIGCGCCVDQCPQGALALHLLNTGYKGQVRVAL
ncbi:MAG: 4Fe-4S binding protein [Desulfobacterales bacterium]|nr:4Fe-4S binding protein [Desulfobacterales bacterium]